MEERSKLGVENEELVAEGRLDLDRVLIEEVGQFGWYQARFMAVSLLIVLSFSTLTAEFISTSARVPTRCLIPECENSTENVQFAAEWLAYALPNTSTGFDNCRRFARAAINDTSPEDKCSITLFDRTTTEPCEAYVYENANTVVYDFGLACDEWRRSLIGSMRTLGTLFAMPLTGYVSDRWGRRTALVVNLFNIGIIGLTRCWATNYITFIAAEFLETALGSGTYTCIFIIIMEVVGPKYRVAAGAMYSTFFALGHVVSGVIAAFVPNWRHFTLVLYITNLTVTVVTIWFTTESVRWYITKGRTEKTEKLLKKIARVNGKRLSETTLLALKRSAIISKETQMMKKENSPREPRLIAQVWNHKPILLRCLVAPVWWMTFSFIYYGLTINSVTLSMGSMLANYLAVSMFEVPGYCAACALVNRVGRKPVLAGGYWLCALAQLGFLLTPAGYPKISLALYMVGKGSISMVVTSLYLYTSELFPTRRRHSLVAFCSMLGRVGAILAPLTPAFGGQLPFMLFAGMSLVSGLLILLTPETLGCRLPDTMEEAATIGRDDLMITS